MANPILFQATVLDLVPFGNVGNQARFFALRLSIPPWAEWKAGQFVMVRPSGRGYEPQWARPFSICRVSNHDLVLFFQVVGRGTAHLAALTSGDILDIWGPLGNGFAVEPEKQTLLLAGGIGIVPFVAYVHTHPAPWNLSLDFGHRMPLECYPFESINEKIYADAYQEKKPGDLDRFIEHMDTRIAAHKSDLVLACGPTPFLKTVQQLSAKHGARTQLCLETKMACGIGACLGCVVKAKMGGSESSESSQDAAAWHNVQTCTCGPVFWADRVEL